MPITLAMPALSPTMEEGTLARWLVGEGDRVAAGDVIAEIETDKATMEYEAPAAGVIARIIVAAGSAGVAVRTPVALLAEEGEDAASVAAGWQPAGPVQTAVAPVPARPAGNGAAGAGAPAVASGRVAASPLARRLAATRGVDLAGLSGSGPRGRIVSRDVEAAASISATRETGRPVLAVPPPAPEPARAPAAASPYPPGSYEIVELDPMRRTIARRLTESKQTVPHFYLRADIELDAALALRAQINAAAPRDGAEPAWKISVNDMMIKALACALRDVPEANVTWDDGRMLRHKPVDVAVAVALDGGLITPVVRDAGTKTLSVISNEMKRLAARARERKLAPEDYQGGTTSLSNLGMFGVSSFDAVINPPHGTILAVGAAERRFVVRGEAGVIATVMTVTLSVDHRTVDGALGARLLAAFKRLVENPLALLA